MAVDKKISQLTSLAQVDVAASTDVLPIVDTSATETKKITVSALVGAGATAGLTNVDINSGTIDGTTIGASSASTGAFTTLSASSTVSGTGFSTYLASPPAIGSTAANTGAFTTLSASSTVTFNQANASTSLAPIGTGTVTINPATAGTINNMAIGGSTAAAGTFTTITGTSVVNALGAAGTPSYTFTGDLNTGMWSPTADTVAWSTGGSERMRIDSAGRVGIGGTAQASDKTNITGTFPASAGASTGCNVNGTIPSSATLFGFSYQSNTSVENASFTLGNWAHFAAYPGAIGASATVTNQFGVYIDSSLTGATNNYGLYSNIASGSNRWNFYAAGTAQNYFAGNVLVGTTTAAAGGLLTLNRAPAAAFGTPMLQVGGASFTSGGYYSIGLGFTDATYTEPPGEIVFITDSSSGGTNGAIAFGTRSVTTNTAVTERMRIDNSGNVGIGGTADAYGKVQIKGTLPTSSTISQGLSSQGTVPSGSTGGAYLFHTTASTATASFTCADLYHYFTYQGTFGAGSAVTRQYGFYADASLTGATNNYGFYSGIASGSNRWNFYAAGTAANYFAGDTGIGRAPIAGVRLIARGADTGSANYALICYDSADQVLLYARNDGLISTGNRANSPYNYTTANAANLYVDSGGLLYRSTSSLRYKSDVTNATHGLADVLKLRSVTYKGKNDRDKTFGGLIAEEVHDAGLTEFVAYDKEGRPDALHYGNMVALLVKAVQELSAKVVALEAR